MNGHAAGGRQPFPPGKFNPFKYWIPDSEHLRKVSSFGLESFEGSTTPVDLHWVHGKYGATRVRLKNARDGNPLDLSIDEGIEYLLSRRLENLTKEFMERIGITA